MNTIVEVYGVAYKNAESLVRKAKFYLKGYHKFERPTVEQAIEALLFVDFKRGTINNYHAKYEPEQHIAYWSPQLAQDIDDVNERFAFFKDEMYKQLHTTNQQTISQFEDYNMLINQIEDIKQREFLFLKTENEKIIKKYYDKIPNYWLGFYYLKI